MPPTPRLFTKLSRKVSWLLAAKILLSLIVFVCATSIIVTTSNYQAELGSAVNVTNGLLVTDKGFYLATTSSSSNSTACASPVTFGSIGQVANNGITSGDLVYTVRVNSTSTATPSQTYNVTFVLGSSTFGPLCIQTPASPQNGQTIDCKFDIATNNLPASPYTFKVTIQ